MSEFCSNCGFPHAAHNFRDALACTDAIGRRGAVAEITRLRGVIAGMETRRVMDLAAKDEAIGELLETLDVLAIVSERGTSPRPGGVSLEELAERFGLGGTT